MTCETVNFEFENKKGSIGRFVDWFRTGQQQRRERAGFSVMLKLEDHILADIGVTRGSVEWANRLPVDRDAGRELAKSVGRNAVEFPR
jgi:uncharacterized protein YjiS (DUF1127 family)